MANLKTTVTNFRIFITSLLIGFIPLMISLFILGVVARIGLFFLKVGFNLVNL